MNFAINSLEIYERLKIAVNLLLSVAFNPSLIFFPNIEQLLIFLFHVQNQHIFL